MKALKITDVIIQLSLFVFFAVKACIGSGDMVTGLLPAYFVIGGYQVISCMLQLPYVRGTKQSASRIVYQKMLLSLVVAGIIMIPIFLFFLLALLGLGPVLAIFYCGLSIQETVKIMGYEK